MTAQATRCGTEEEGVCASGTQDGERQGHGGRGTRTRSGRRPTGEGERDCGGDAKLRTRSPGRTRWLVPAVRCFAGGLLPRRRALAAGRIAPTHSSGWQQRPQRAPSATLALAHRRCPRPFSFLPQETSIRSVSPSSSHGKGARESRMTLRFVLPSPFVAAADPFRPPRSPCVYVTLADAASLSPDLPWNHHSRGSSLFTRIPPALTKLTVLALPALPAIS